MIHPVYYMQSDGVYRLAENGPENMTHQVDASDLVAKMQEAWDSLRRTPNERPVFLLTDSLSRARKVRRWRGKKFVFRGLHDALTGIVR